MGEDGVALVFTIFTADLEPLPGAEGGGDVGALGGLADVGPEIFGVALNRIDAKSEHPVARAGVEGVAERALGIGGGGEGERAAIEVSALGIAGDHTAGIAGAEEQGVGTADGFDALNIKRVEQRGIGAQKTVTAGIVNLEPAHRHALRILAVALKVTAHVFVAGTDERGAEAAELGEHLGGIDDTELVHELAVEDFGVERGFAQRRVGAGDRIGVGRVVGVIGVGVDLKRIKRDRLILTGGFRGGRSRGRSSRLRPDATGRGEHECDQKPG